MIRELEVLKSTMNRIVCMEDPVVTITVGEQEFTLVGEEAHAYGCGMQAVMGVVEALELDKLEMEDVLAALGK